MAAPDTIRGIDTHEAVEDFSLACVSRAIDDREINLQKRSEVFFQISGAGHEALLLALARDLRPGYDWFFPYYRDLALVLGLGVSPYEVLLQAAMNGESARFTRQDSVEETWRILQPLLDSPPPVHGYAKGTWGPPECDQLVSGHGTWHEPWLPE